MPRPRKCRCTARCTRPGRAARAVVHLHSTHSVALSMLPEIDPRAALPPMTAYYLMKCGATALVPYYRPGRSRGGRRHQGAGRQIFVRAARQSRPGGVGRHAGSGGVRDRGTGRDRKTLSAAARAEPALSHAGAGGGFVEDVRGGVAGAWARTTPVILRSHAEHARLDGMVAVLPSVETPLSRVLGHERGYARPPERYNPRYALRTSGLPLISSAVPCICKRPVCRM